MLVQNVYTDLIRVLIQRLFNLLQKLQWQLLVIDDTSNNDELAEVIPSYYWVAPPDDDSSTYPDGPMKGLTALPNGIMAGFTGKRVCFSEAFLTACLAHFLSYGNRR